MPNEKLPEINEHDAEELIHYPQDEEQKERRSRLLPGRWTRRVQKSSARAQARRRVAEKTSEDHAYLMLGAVPFWAVGATSLQNGIILCAVLIILMLPCSALHLILRRKLNLAEWVALPLTVLVAAMLAAACCVALVLYWPGAFDSWESISSCWWRPRCCCRRIAIPRWITCGNSGDGRCAFCGTSALSSW